MITVSLKRSAVAAIVMMVAFAVVLSGCSRIKPYSSKSEPTPVITNQAKETGNPPLYYDFNDVLIPNDLKVDKKSSYIVQSPGFLSGILALKGRIERNALVAFFQTNMAKDNWREIGLFKSPRTSSIIVFQKENRLCVISIEEKDYYTYVEIGVAPTLGGPESGLLK